MNKLLASASIAALLLASPAEAQFGPHGGGGGSGGGGISPLVTTCPPTSTSSGTGTVDDGVHAAAKSSPYTVAPSDCGNLIKASAPITLPGFSGGGSVSGGFNVAIKAVGTQTVTTTTGNISTSGTPGPSVSLTDGQTMVFIVNPTDDGYEGSTGPAGPAGITGAGATSPSVWYLPWGMTSAAAGSAPNATTTYCTPGWVNNLSPTGSGSGTLNGLATRITTLGTSNIQLAIYANDATATPYRPGTLVASTASIVDTATGAVSGTVSASITGSALYWFCEQANDATVRFLAKAAAAPDLSLSYLVGSPTLGTALGSTAVNGGVSTPGTFGTWPSLHGSAWADIGALAPIVAFSFASIP